MKSIFGRQSLSKKTVKKNKNTNKKTAFKPVSPSDWSTGMIIRLSILAGVLVFGVSGWLWWSNVLMNPQRLLNDAIANNLRSKSITRHITQSGQTGGVDQVTYLSFFAPTDTAQSKTVLTQTTAQNKSASVTTETIGTNKADYVKYSSVKGAEGLSGIENLNKLLGIWAKREAGPKTGQQISFLNEALFGVFPFGDFSQQQQTQLLDLINQKKIYSYTNAEKQIENKRPVYVYTFSIKPADLISVLKEYAALTGSGDGSQLDPAQYQGSGPIEVKATIDIFSRQLTKVEYPQTGRTEVFSGQNLYNPVVIPSQTIPVDELQRRLQGTAA